jgi:superfamily II DNA or RNA helicase
VGAALTSSGESDRKLPQPGDIVRVRTRRYLVESAEPGPDPIVAAVCMDDDAQGDPLEVVWNLELDTEILGKDVWKSIGRKGFDSRRYFAAYVQTLRWNCVTATDPRLFQSPFRAGIRLDAYQLEPLRKALLLPRVNLFIADDVGLGKTIEAGLIASELLLRRRVREIVVACPPTMLPQWNDEMEARFGLTFQILDRNYIDQVRQQYGFAVNPWSTFPRFLVSHNLLIDESYAGPLCAWLDNFRAGTLLILDEAHHAAPSSGARYAIDSRITRAIRDIAPRFEHRLFLSATPHNGHSNSFSALLEILDSYRFTRGVPVLKGQLDQIIVRRLKEDIRKLEGGFPERKVVQVDIDGLPLDAPELRLAKLLNDYNDVRNLRMTGATKRKQAEAKLLISGLQERLLSSIEAFARTLKVHRRTMEKLWAAEKPVEAVTALDPQLVLGSLDADDERSQLPEEEQEKLRDAAIEAATESAAGDQSRADINAEKKLLEEMEQIAEASRGLPDARIVKLIEWVKSNMCASVRVPGKSPSQPNASWSDNRLLIFTEYEDTRRYIVSMLKAAVSETSHAEDRIAVFSGATGPRDREAIKLAFNASPSEHSLRILVATDAAREGINLQAHCSNLFHFDLPWNPSRIEQRNGRIDRKLQPAEEVLCHYFFYKQREEDRILKALVRKTDTIRRELGSLAEVLEERLHEAVKLGISRREIDQKVVEIENAGLEPQKRATAEEELESARTRQDTLLREIERLQDRLEKAKEWIALDNDALRDAISCSLEMLNADPLKPTDLNGRSRFQFPNLEARHGADPTWSATLDTLRKPPKDGRRNFEWRKNSPIRPVVFNAPPGIDDDIVQLHLQHRVVQRLLGRFLSQGFVHHDLSRACLAQTDDPIPRIILLGRLSLYGKGAVRLHEEILTVTARWTEPSIRRGQLTPYAREAETKTLDLLEKALTPTSVRAVPAKVSERLLISLPRDIEELLPHLEQQGRLAKEEAEELLAQRGEAESQSIRRILEDQRKRVSGHLGKSAQLILGLQGDDEKRQFEADRKSWERWLKRYQQDIQREPGRVKDFYTVTSFRLEPTGVAYLWPVTG